VTVNVLANDSDADGDALTVTSVTDGTNGTAAVNPDGTVTFTPNADFNGTGSFTYTVSDSQGATDSAMVSITVTSVNDLPLANDDAATTPEDTPVMIDVLVNDSDADGNALSIDTFTDAVNGTVALVGGQLVYTPNGNFFGADTFTYTVSDGQGGTDTATVSITVTSVNDVPLANDDATTTPEDTPITVDVLANDSDVDGDTLKITGITDGANGTAVLNTDGTVTFTPNANFFGSDTFTYTVNDGQGGTDSATVSITVTSVNDVPVANDDTATTLEDTPITVDVLANDTDADSDTLAITGVTDGANGTAVLNADGTVTFTPNANFFGSDSFTYTVSDGQGGTDSATVGVTVGSVNDVPVADDDGATTPEDTPITVDVLANDTDADGNPLAIDTFTDGANGTVALLGGQLVYTPAANFFGTDSFTYTASDGQGGTDGATVTITVGSVNDAPVVNDDAATTLEDTPITVDVLANDTDADGDALATVGVTDGTNGTAVINADGTVTFTPNANFFGSDSFTYTASDGQGGTGSATVSITVSPGNNAPVATDDALAATEDTPVTYTAAQLLGNDTDVDGDALTIGSITSGANGTAVLNADGTVTFTPDANFNGTADFTYTVTDGSLTSNAAAVVVGVAPVNDAPVANDDALAATENTPVTYTAAQLLANDTDIDSSALTIASVTSGTNGTAVLNADGTVTFTPDADFNGTADFTYTVTDGSLASNVATVVVAVAPAGTSGTIDIEKYVKLSADEACGDEQSGGDHGDDGHQGSDHNDDDHPGIDRDDDHSGFDDRGDGDHDEDGSGGDRDHGEGGTRLTWGYGYSESSDSHHSGDQDEHDGDDDDHHSDSDGRGDDDHEDDPSPSEYRFGLDADTAPGLTANVGEEVTFTYVVTNPGDVSLSNVTVVDDNETPTIASDDFQPGAILANGFNVGDADQDGLLDPGEAWLYTWTTLVTEGQHVNVATVTGSPAQGAGTVSDYDPAYWIGMTNNTASLGDFVWHDLDADGIQDAREQGVEGVVVNLLDASSAVVASSTTDAKGFYEFTGLAAGTYTVEIAPINFAPGGSLTGWAATLRDQGAKEAKDSDGDPITHRSDTVILAGGHQRTDIDFGFKSSADDGCGKGNNGIGNGLDPQPPGNPPMNDGEGTAPGHPGNKGGADPRHEVERSSDASAERHGDAMSASKAAAHDPHAEDMRVFDAITGSFQVPSSSLGDHEKQRPVSEMGRAPTAPRTLGGSDTPVVTGSTRLIDWSGNFTEASGTASAAEGKCAIDWAGSFGHGAVPLAAPGATGWLIDASGNRPNRSERTEESDRPG
jgi:hypothetical protein